MKSRSAFTLVELLVVIGIISVLMSMLLPAVQKAREAASKLRCSNSLRQIGIAYHVYNDRCGELPGYAWVPQLLPLLEDNTPTSGSITSNRPGLICSSRSLNSVARIDYCGGTYRLGVGMPWTDTDSSLNAVRVADIIDGMSNTMWIAEKSSVTRLTPPPAGLQVQESWGMNSTKIDITSGAGVCEEYGRTPVGDSAQMDGSVPMMEDTYTYTTAGIPQSMAGPLFNPWWTDYVYVYSATAPVTFIRYRPTSGNLGFGSAHVGSMNFLLCDGSVHHFRYGATGLQKLYFKNDGVTNYD